jgi:chitinase
VGTNVYGCAKQLFLLKKRHRNLKVLLSIGGWTYSANFAAPAATQAGRTRFAETAVRILRDLGFDGLDVDWEYPKDAGEAQNFVLLLEEVRRELDRFSEQCGHHRPHFLLTIAAPAGPQNYGKLPLGELAQRLDFINLMGYDYAGSWDQKAGHQANLFASHRNPACTPFSTEKAVRDYLAAGVPPEKLVLGMPLYGRAFQNTKGPGEPYSGVGEGSWENGVWDYKALPRPGAHVKVDEEVGASFCIDGAGTMVSYDTPDLARRKVRFIEEHRLGGAMWWESSGDKSGEESLIGTVVREMGGHGKGKMEHKENWLEYPDSKYENLRKGFPGE